MSEQARTALENALKLENDYDFEGAKKIYGDILDNVVEEQVLEKSPLANGGHGRPHRRESHLPAYR